MEITGSPVGAMTKTPPELAMAQAAAMPVSGFKPIGPEQTTELVSILNRYRDGKRSIDSRIIHAEQWWKLRNAQQAAEEEGKKSVSPGFKSQSAWLHSLIKNKHADATDAFPEPDILPREVSDQAEARKLSKIIPCIFEQARFERVYSAANWRKRKFGTSVYKMVWDKEKLGGLGDISITSCNILNLFWEPGVEDIQQSRYFFEVDFRDEDELAEAYPQLKGQALPKNIYTSKYRYDDNVDTSDKVPVISCYYHKRGVLHYILFVPGFVLFATENEPDFAERGLYDHGKYPYYFSALYPIEGSPCGYGDVDLYMYSQIEIDKMKTAMVENTVVGSKPRYIMREGCGINADDFLDAEKALIKASGAIDENFLLRVPYEALPGNYISILQETINEMRETSGNTETSTGTTSGGVTAASAIAALQEASGKSSRDANASEYCTYQDMVYDCIELVRQFYDMPRMFRITGDDGSLEFVSYSNAGIQPAMQYDELGKEIGLRKPVFDIKVVPQRRSAYTKMANNDLALKLYGIGFFNPQASDQALAALTIMDFDSKDELVQVVRRNGTMFEKLQMLSQYCLMLAMKSGDPVAQQQVAAMIQSINGGEAPQGSLPQVQPGSDGGQTRMNNARQQTRSAPLPTEGGSTTT